MMPNIYIHQIFYNPQTHEQLDAGFIPLDNSKGRADWYEFGAIRDFLHSNALEEHAFYGFLSPKFTKKTGLDSEALSEFIQNHLKDEVDAFVVSPVWSHTVFFRNVFEQGEFFHKGLWQAAEHFFKYASIEVDLKTLVTHSQNTAFGNYIIAQPDFWRQWLRLADQLFEWVENPPDEHARRLSELVYYGGRPMAPLKVFLQERLATLILATQPIKVMAYDTSHGPLCLDIVNHNDYFRTDLLACDALKIAFTVSKQPIFERAYLNKREEIELKFRQMHLA